MKHHCSMSHRRMQMVCKGTWWLRRVWYRLLPEWMLTLCCVVVILWLTLSPRPLGYTGLTLFPGADKVGHALCFGAFALCVFADWQRWRPRGDKCYCRLLLSSAVSFVFGIAVEFLQGWMNLGRSFDVADIGADFAGCVVAPVLWLLAASRHS